MLSYSFDITTQPAFISLFMSSVTSLSGILIVNIKQISQIFLMSHLPPFNKQIPTGHYHVSFAFRRYFHKALQKTRIMNKNNDYSILSICFMSQRVEMVAFFEGRKYWQQFQPYFLVTYKIFTKVQKTKIPLSSLTSNNYTIRNHLKNCREVTMTSFPADV